MQDGDVSSPNVSTETFVECSFSLDFSQNLASEGREYCRDNTRVSQELARQVL